MSFELLDTILSEAGVPGTQKDVAVKEDADIYANIDQLIEDAMRESLRDTVINSDILAESKIDQLQVVENATFTPEQMSTFVENTIHPIMILSDSFNLEKSGEKVSVPIELYETAILIARASGELGEDGTLYESIFGSSITEQELARELTGIFEFYGYDEKEDQEELVELAVELVEKFDLDYIEPSVVDLAEMVMIWNDLHESGLIEVSINEFLQEADKGKADKKKISERIAAMRKSVGEKAGKAWTGAKAKAGAAKKFAGEKAGKAWAGIKSGAGKAGAGIKSGAGKALGTAKKGFMKDGKFSAKRSAITTAAAAAVATGGALAYRAFKNRKCAGLTGDAKTACLKKAYGEAIKAEKAKLSACSSAKDPAKCKAKIQKSIAKWQAKM